MGIWGMSRRFCNQVLSTQVVLGDRVKVFWEDEVQKGVTILVLYRVFRDKVTTLRFLSNMLVMEYKSLLIRILVASY